MNLPEVCWIYLITFLIILSVLWSLGLSVWSAFIITLVGCQLILLIAKPPYDIDIENDDLSCVAIYHFIILMTIIIVYTYAVLMAIMTPRRV